MAQVDTKQLAMDAGTKADHIYVADLANWLIEGRGDFLIVDVRDAKDYAEYHIPGAVNVPLAALNSDFAGRNERIIFYSDGGIHAAQAWLLLKAQGFRGVYMLFGGLEEWKDSILFPKAPAANAPAMEQIEFAKRAAIAKHFGGAPQGASDSNSPAKQVMPKLVPSAPAETPAQPNAAPKKKKEGC